MTAGRFFGAFFKVLISMVLTVCLCAGLVLAVSLYSLRMSFAKPNVERWLDENNIATLELPDGEGQTTTILDELNAFLSSLGGSVSEKQVTSVMKAFSIDVIVKDAAEDIRAWIFDTGVQPILDPYRYADIIIDGAEGDVQSILSLISLFGSQREILANILAGYTDSVNNSEDFAELGELHGYVGSETLYILVSALCMVVLIMLIVLWHRKRNVFLCVGLSALSAGGLLFAGAKFILSSPSLVAQYVDFPSSTLYAVLTPCLNRLTGYAAYAIIAGGALLVLWLLTVIIVTAVSGGKPKAYNHVTEDEADCFDDSDSENGENE